MTPAVRLPLLAAVALTGLGLTAPVQAQQASVSFFVTSVGKGNGADLGGIHAVGVGPTEIVVEAA